MVVGLLQKKTTLYCRLSLCWPQRKTTLLYFGLSWLLGKYKIRILDYRCRGSIKTICVCLVVMDVGPKYTKHNSVLLVVVVSVKKTTEFGRCWLSFVLVQLEKHDSVVLLVVVLIQ